MATTTNKPRITVTLSHDNFQKLTMYANAMGVTKSALAAMGLAQYLFSMDKTMAAVEQMPEVATGQITMEQLLSKMVDSEK